MKQENERLIPLQVAKEVLGQYPSRSRRAYYTYVLLRMGLGAFDVLNALALGALAALAAVVAGAVAPTGVLAQLLDQIGDPLRALRICGLAAIILFAVKGFSEYYVRRRMLMFIANREYQISAELVQRFLRLPLSRIQSWGNVDAAFSVGQGVAGGSLLLGAISSAFAELLVLIIMTGLLFAFNPLAALCVLGIMGLLAYSLQRYSSPRLIKNTATINQSAVQSQETFQEGLFAYREVNAAGRVPWLVSRYTGFRSQGALATGNQIITSQVPSLILQYGIFIGTAAFTLSIFWDGGGPQSFAILAIFGAAGSRMAGAVGPLQNSWNIAISVVPQAQRMLKLTRWLNENESTSVQQDFALSLSNREKFVPAIEFKDVSFSYEGSESPALTNVSFTVPEFSMLAIAGPSGSGKSTLVDLLLGMNSPDSGQILLGGQDPRGVRSEWPGILGYVPQSVYAADRSLAENVALGFDRDDIDEAQVWKALEQAQLDVLVRTWPEMLNTKMGDLGSRMSGGQQQRLGLARALYTQPSILVLDEATSALDAETEAAITSTLESLRSHMTLVVIAHRLSTVQKADSVMLLEDGSCLGAGTFNEMRERFPQFDRQAKLLGL